jgi:exopolysaccharide biosynthesis polyprenyl glycosylphosphotransferase
LSTPSLHVLLVITKGEVGGAQSHVLELCRALRDRVRLSAVIGGPPDSPLALGLQALGIGTVAMPELRNSLNPMHLLATVRALRALLLRDPPHLMHAHSAIAGVVARLAGKLCQVPVVYTVHGFGFKPEVPVRTRWSAWLAEAVLAAWTTRMVCVSQHERQLALRLPLAPERISVVPNALDDVPWQSTQQIPHATVVMVARMAAPKRHDLLLHALALLARQGLCPDTSLLGDGPQRGAHQQLAAQLELPHVRLNGDVHNVAEQLAQHTIFVLLSDHEGLPMSLIEAMRAGMAIVASRLPGIEELVRHEDSALLVDNDPLAVAAALQRLLQDAPLRQRLARAARAAYEASHRPEALANSTFALYQEAPVLPPPTWSMIWPRRHPAALASARARQQHSQLLWALLGCGMLGWAWLTGQWLQAQGWVTHDFGRTVLACAVPYFVASHLLYRGSHLPAAERGVLRLVTTTVPFVLTPLGFALLQLPYSRSALLLSYLLTVAWFWLGDRWLSALRPLKLLYWHEDQRAELDALLVALGEGDRAAARQRLQLVRWPDHWQQPDNDCPDTLAVDGALTDSGQATPLPAQAGLDEHLRRNILTALKMRHIRLYSPQSVAQALSGRMPDSVLASALWQPDGNPAYDLVKRLLDLAAVLLTLPLWLPLAAFVALAVRIDSPGPAVFSQWRTGLHGRPFRIHKFRSMRHEQIDTPRFAGQDDPRITRLGAWLRRSRLDEIPQLWNVLRGDMSLIGPRPEQAAFVRQFAEDIPSYPWRHLVRPGVTGWAQVQQGYAAGHAETAVKLSYDLYYVNHYSLAMDLLILAKTLRTVLTGHGAR